MGGHLQQMRNTFIRVGTSARHLSTDHNDTSTMVQRMTPSLLVLLCPSGWLVRVLLTSLAHEFRSLKISKNCLVF